jgi:hypothetical protein
MTKRSLLECVVGLAGLDRPSFSLLECVVGRAPKSTPTTAQPVLHVQRKHCASQLSVCPSARLPVCRARNSRNVECRLDSQPTKPADDAATGLRCAALQPASLTGVDPSRRPPVVALALPTYRIVATLHLSHRRNPPPIASLQTQHANSSTHAAKPNANAHTPLPTRARANVSSRFSIAVWTLHPDWARASPDSAWDSSFAV